MCDIFSWDNMGNLGSLIGGLSALSAVVFWRTDQRTLKKSEVANEAIIGCEKLKRALEDYTGIQMQILAKNKNIIKFKEIFRWAQKANKSNLEDFSSAYLHARTFLKENIDIIHLFKEIDSDNELLKRDLLCVCLNVGDEEERTAKISSIFGAREKNEREARIDKLIEKLQIIARLEN